MHISVNAPAKINLTFDITGDLPGGYHSIVSIFHAITLEDRLSVEIETGANAQPHVEITAEFVGAPGVFPLDDNNLISKAIKAFHLKTGLLENKSLRIGVKKQIPIGAGLAGGSADAAAMLVALQHLFEDKSNSISNEQLAEIAITLGADVPFLLSGGTQFGKGKGEILAPLNVSQNLTFVVVKPRQIAVSTPAAFAAYDKFLSEKLEGWKPPIDHESAARNLVDGEIRSATKYFGNVFEPVVFNMHPRLALIKDRLLEIGCWSAQLSGSGPSIFATVENLQMANMVCRKFKDEAYTRDSAWTKFGDEVWELDCFIAESAGCGVKVVSGVK